MNSKTFLHIIRHWDEYDRRKADPRTFDASLQWECDFLAGRISAYCPFLIRARIYQAIEQCRTARASMQRRQFAKLVMRRLGLL